MMKTFDTDNLTMTQAIAGVQAVAERLINERDAARVEAAKANKWASQVKKQYIALAKVSDTQDDLLATARAEVERLTLGESILNERLTAARAEIGELKVQIRGLQIAARPMEPTESALMILLARQELLADTLQAERNEIVEALDTYGWWMDNENLLERLKFALATCQEKSDDLSTIRMLQRGASA